MPKKRLQQRYKDRNPEKDYADDNALFEDIEGDLKGLDEYKTKNTETNEKLIGVLRSHPEIAKFIRDIAKGAPVGEALARNFDLEAITPADGDPDFDSWEKGLGDRAASLKEKDDYEAQLQENSDVSVKTMKDFVAKNDVSEESAAEFFDLIDSIFQDAADGKIEEATLTALYTHVKHDEVVADEVEKATVQAKNAKIEEAATTEENVGDGLPDVQSGGGAKAAMETKPVKSDPFLDAIEQRRS